ncbi:hypothetical protein GGR15_001440 [Butyricimonas paravirosa]|uniref:Uncharacterized protein n=1 Tax=Butyricimonas paravirosa TaxID=1472417 RepID=A0A7X5YB11_9BACT|nr:hypothetical protein [Butyricimonas paravirosa]
MCGSSGRQTARQRSTSRAKKAGVSAKSSQSSRARVIPEMRATLSGEQWLSRARVAMKSRFMMTLRLCVSRCPSASLTALPIMMPIVRWAIPSSSARRRVSPI